MTQQQISQMAEGSGFIAALDQSGGSTPKALERYGISNDAWSSEDEMFDLVHEMRVRIMSNEAFGRPGVLGAILFDGTMRRSVGDTPTARYLWDEKSVLPFLKIDVGLADQSEGVQLMKPIESLRERCGEAKSFGIFGTKMRSVIKSDQPAGIAAVASQQFEYAQTIANAGLVPIVEPEVDIEADNKGDVELKLLSELRKGLDDLTDGTKIVFKLTLPEQSNLYREFTHHEKVLRVAALSGGYSQEESNRRLGNNEGMIASFSRALTELLRVNQTDAEFTEALASSIDSIAAASSA